MRYVDCGLPEVAEIAISSGLSECFHGVGELPRKKTWRG